MRAYIVLDLEWNQSPSGKARENAKIPFEILEIGAVKLNESLEEVDTFREIIKPRVYHELHFKIAEVTSLSIDELRSKGKPFHEAVRRFLEWCGRDFIFCTWGSMDLTELQRNMKYYKVENTLKKPLLFYDIQKLHSLLYEEGKNKKALDTVVRELGLASDSPFHRALDDACYTAKVMHEIDFNRVQEYVSVDYFRPPMKPEEEVYLEFANYSKYVSRVYDTREEALLNKQVVSTRCYQCKKLLRKKIRWFSSNTKFYFCLAWCPNHGYLKGKIRIKKTDNHQVFVVKTLKLVGEEDAIMIREKQEELRARRQERRKKERMLHKKEVKQVD